MSEIRFSATAHWAGADDGSGTVDADGLSSAKISLPRHFGGELPGTNPEELLLSSLASCLSMTLAFIYDGRGLRFKTIQVGATGYMQRGPLRFEHIDARISVDADETSDLARLEDLAKQAHEKCLVSSIVKKSCPLHIDVEIRQGT